MIDVHPSNPRLFLIIDRCKQAECERQKEEIQSLKLEIALLQKRASATASPSVSNAEGVLASSIPSNIATCGTPDTKKSETTEEKKTSEGETNPSQTSGGEVYNG